MTYSSSKVFWVANVAFTALFVAESFLPESVELDEGRVRRRACSRVLRGGISSSSSIASPFAAYHRLPIARLPPPVSLIYSSFCLSSSSTLSCASFSSQIFFALCASKSAVGLSPTYGIQIRPRRALCTQHAHSVEQGVQDLLSL